MDWDDRIGLDNNASFLMWIRKYDDARGNQLTDWVSTFHRDRLPCKLTTHKCHDGRGAYNLGCKVEFENGEKWVIRLPMVGKVINADEKIEIEVATMDLIRQRTTIPIPKVKAWGLAAENPLGIGPFIMMEFIEGISVNDIVQTHDARIMRKDISEETIEVLFRQMINFSLQLRKLDFPRIGSLDSTSNADEDGFAATVRSRPLTKKAHDFLLDGGVDVLGRQDQTFASTTEYFHHVVNRDMQHLREQPNSVDDEHDAKEKYLFFKVMEALIQRHVLPDYDKGPFKLMCDDFQPANMIVNNEKDLKVVAVLDWEWSYSAPTQLVDTPPTWLVIESPNVWASIDERFARYNKHLELYIRLLEEEESKVFGNGVAENHKPSTILRACLKDGRQWFHFILLRGFNGPTCVPFTKLREETKDWDELVAAVPDEEVNSFVQQKMAELSNYEKQLSEMEKRYKLALKGDLQDLGVFLSQNAETLSLDSSRYKWQSWTCFDRSFSLEG